MSSGENLSKSQILVCLTAMVVAVCAVVCVFLLRPSARPGQVEAPEKVQEPDIPDNRAVPAPERRPPGWRPMTRKRTDDAIVSADGEERAGEPSRKRRVRGRRRPQRQETIPAPASAADMLRLLSAARDHDDPSSLESLFAQASVSTDAAVRLSLAHTLAWFGVRSLPRLARLLTDPDPGVRHAALNQWRLILLEVPDEERRARAIEIAAAELSDATALKEIFAEYGGINAATAKDSLARIVSGGNAPAVSAAKARLEVLR